MVDSVQSPIDFCKKIAETFNWKVVAVEAYLEFEEDKEGFFWAKLKPKMYLENHEFRVLCTLTKDLKGQDYLKGARAWKVPGPLAKKADVTPQGSALPGIIKATGQSNAQTSPPLLGQTILKDDTHVYMPIALPLTALVHMPFRSRVSIDGPDFDELVESVKECGILEPLVVRFLKTGFYEIVAGERRFRAAERAGLKAVPTVIRPLTDEQAYEVQLIENIQRKDLSDMEKARMLDYMVKNFNCTQEALAKKLGKSQSWVSLHLGMLQMPESITRVIKHGEITEYQAREILAAPENKQQEIVNEINKTGEVPSAREIHSIVHPEEKAPPIGHLKPQDMSEGQIREFLDNPKVKEIVVAMSPTEFIPKTHEQVGESIPSPMEDSESIPNGSKGSVETGPCNIQITKELECSECHQHFVIEHHSNGKHSVKYVREVPA